MFPPKVVIILERQPHSNYSDSYQCSIASLPLSFSDEIGSTRYGFDTSVQNADDTFGKDSK